MELHISDQYSDAVNAIKSAIIQSRYQAARSINKEALALYYYVGKYISEHSRKQWGTNAIAAISQRLQKELPGLRGFSEMALKRMRRFYEEWCPVFENTENDISNCSLKGNVNRPLLMVDSQPSKLMSYNEQIIIRPLATTKLSINELQAFLSTPFTHHYELLSKTKSLSARLFYIEHISQEFWTVEKLKYNLREQLYEKRASMPNNFLRTISGEQLQQLANNAFRDEYLLDFISVKDPDLFDEHQVEDAIVHNIRKFILALGTDFSFMGNQFRLIVDEKEYFIDLLFFNRHLRSLVAIELKWTDFRPEYVGKMNFYLSALDDTIRLPNENPSVGIILCRGKSEKTVEYALRDTTKPMGVATYKTANELPDEFKNALGRLDNLTQFI